MAGIEILVTGATGWTGQAAIRHLLASGHQVRAFAHRKDERSDALAKLGAELVFGDFNDFASVKSALKGIKRAYFCHPISKGLVQATVLFGQAAREEGLEAIVNMSQKIAREDAASHANDAR